MRADFITGKAPSPDELKRLEDLTLCSQYGYFNGSLETMAEYARNLGLHAKAYTYRQGDPREIQDLDHELAQGHGALIRVRNPRTQNPVGHWIYCAGKDQNGNYIIGDPDRKNNIAAFGHDRPVSQEHLVSMMNYRDGFVAGWADGPAAG